VLTILLLVGLVCTVCSGPCCKYRLQSVGHITNNARKTFHICPWSHGHSYLLENIREGQRIRPQRTATDQAAEYQRIRNDSLAIISNITTVTCEGKAIPLQAWSGLEGSRKLRFPDFITTEQGGVKVFSLTHRPHLPPGNSPDTHFC
jgi:hypothetical protein